MSSFPLFETTISSGVFPPFTAKRAGLTTYGLAPFCSKYSHNRALSSLFLKFGNSLTTKYKGVISERLFAFTSASFSISTLDTSSYPL